MFKQGQKHKITMLAEKLMRDDVENVVAAVVDAARKGDMAAAKIILDRIAPARRDRPVSFDLPKIERPADAVAASAAILDAVSEGAFDTPQGGRNCEIDRRGCENSQEVRASSGY